MSTILHAYVCTLMYLIITVIAQLTLPSFFFFPPATLLSHLPLSVVNPSLHPYLPSPLLGHPPVFHISLVASLSPSSCYIIFVRLRAVSLGAHKHVTLCDGTGMLHLSLLQYKTRCVRVVGIGCQSCPQCIPSVFPLSHVQEYHF